MLNNNNSQEDAESFEQAVCSFFQALHPDKEVESSTIPYHEVSKFITKLLDCHQFSPSPLTPASPLSPTLTNGYIYDHHQQEFPKISQTFNIEQHHFMFEHMSASHQATGPEDVKVDKRTIQYKLAHKLPPTGNKGECVAFETLMSLDSSLDCYHLALNSLAMFFSQNTWSTKCQENVLDFLRRFVLQSSGELCRQTGIPANRKQLEIEVMCLLELFIASFSSSSSVCELNIMEKLRLIRYVFGREQVDRFVNDTLYSEFNHCLPQIISTICEKLQISVASPKPELKERKISTVKQEMPTRRIRKAACNLPSPSSQPRCKKEETGDDDESNESISLEPPVKCTKSVLRKAYLSTSDGETPVREVQESEVQEERKSSRQLAQTKKIAKRNLSLKKRMLARRLAVAHQLTNIVKTKLRKRKFITTITSPEPEVEPLKKIRVKAKQTAIKPESSSTPSLTHHACSVSSKNAVVALDDKVMARYKTRMDAIKSNARHNRLNSQEVFYGRSVGRQGLFDFEPEEEESHQSQSSSSSYNVKNGRSGTRQKNRSGRAVKRQEECVYIAHTLLNIHNPRPLQPFKVTALKSVNSTSTFKIRKFVKRASRSERKRMEKFKKSQLANNIPQVV